MVFDVQLLGDLVIRLGLFYAFILFGYLFTRVEWAKTQLSRAVTSVLINLMMPLLIIATLLTADSTVLNSAIGVVIYALFIHLLGFSLMFSRLHNSSAERKKQGSYLLTATFNNALFLPLPIALMFIGEAAVPLIALYSLTQMILLATLGTFIGSAYGENSGNRMAVLKKALTFPPLIAVAIALLLLVSRISVPTVIVPVLNANSVLTTYLALFAVGLSLGTQSMKSRSRHVYEAIAVRQLIVPLTVGILLLLTGLPKLLNSVIILQALTPAAVFTVVYSTALSLDSESAASIVTLGTFLFLPIVFLIPFLFG
jgi:predicted permease